MIVEVNKENVEQQLLKTQSQCMVLGGGIVPTSIHFTSGMEHDKSLGLYGGLLQDGTHQPSNGISDLIGDSRNFDDDAEIEAAAAQSETPMPVVLSGPSTSSLKPLHVQVNGFNGSSSDTSSTSGTRISLGQPSSSTYYPSSQQQRGYRPKNQSPTVRQNKDWYSQRVGTSTSSNTLMGPPSSSSSVLLSPAGNIHNGSARSSGDSSPLSPAAFFQRFHAKRESRESFVHPLATTSSMLPVSTTSLSKPSSSTQQHFRLPSGMSHPTMKESPIPVSPHSNQRKEVELSKRRIVCDKLHKLREDGSVIGFLTHVESQTDTQLAMFLRKSRIERDLPVAIRNEVYDEKTDETSHADYIAKRLNDAYSARTKDNPDEVTDISDNEEDDCETVAKRIRRNEWTPVSVEPEKILWNEQRMRFGVQMARNDLLIEEKQLTLDAVNKQIELIEATSGCRFEGEELQPRKRRIVDGTIQLFDSSPFLRSREDFGCARARPMVSWTKRGLKKNVFQDSTDGSIFDPSVPGCSVIDEKLKTYDNKKIAIGSNEVVTMLTFGENRKREITEYDYKSYEEGKGLVKLKNFSDVNVVDFVTTKDYRPIEKGILSYLHRLSMAPSMTVRKNIHKSIFMESGKDENKRNGAIRQLNIKDKRDEKGKKKDRKNEDMSSDEEDWVPQNNSSRRSSSTKKSRGRPVKPPKKPPRKPAARNVTKNNNREYGLDDFYLDDPCPNVTVSKWAYAHIELPYWYKIDPIKSISNEAEQYDDLFDTVSRNHQGLGTLERSRLNEEKKEKKQKNKAKRAKSSTIEKDEEEDNSSSDEKNSEPSIRRFGSIEKPFEKRTFPTSLP